jgi:hypothetical protein
MDTVVGPILAVETIAKGHGIRALKRLQRCYGRGQWKKLSGIARVRLADGVLALAEVHWYEAHGIGRRELKVKRLIEVQR